MRITERFTADHETFRKMLRELETIAEEPETVRDRKQLTRLVWLFKELLAAHEWFEDCFFHPFLQKALDDASASRAMRLVDRLNNQHRIIEETLKRLEQKIDSGMSQWTDDYQLFSRRMRAHMEKEEAELFPLAEKLLGEGQLEKLAKEAELQREEAPWTRPSPPA